MKIRILFLIVLPWAGIARATLVTTLDGNGADTYVQSTAGNTAPFPNFGNSNSMTVKNPANPNQFTRKPYIRFDLNSLTLQSVQSASLNLTVSVNNSGGGNNAPNSFMVNVFGLNDGAGESWLEGNGGSDNTPAGEIVWGNAPANNTASGTGFTADATFLGQLNVTAADVSGTTVTFASNPALVSFLNADTDKLATFMLARTEGGSKNLTFFSKEGAGGANAPFLDVLQVPEPGALSLYLLGMVLLGGRRKWLRA